MATIILRPTSNGLPAAPVLTAAEPYNAAAIATWTPQGTDVAGFIITAKTTVTAATGDTFTDAFTDTFGQPGASSVVTTSVTAPAGVTSAVIDGLTNGLLYEISVVTRASSGLLSAPSNVRLVTPRATLPSPPAGGGTPTPGTPGTPGTGGTSSTPVKPSTGPLMQAFPPERAFHPGNWLLTAEEVDAK